MANKNPKIDQIKAYTFKTQRQESCTAQLNLRVPPSLLSEIKSRDNWQEFVRQAIAEKLQQSA
jgi:L-lysine 2,3-aminomutase